MMTADVLHTSDGILTHVKADAKTALPPPLTRLQFYVGVEVRAFQLIEAAAHN